MAADVQNFRKWLEISSYRWDQYEEQGLLTALMSAMEPAMELAAQTRQLRLAFELLSLRGESEKYLDDLDKTIESLRRTVTGKLRKSTSIRSLQDTLLRTAPSVQEVLSRMVDTESRVCLLLGHQMVPRVAMLCQFVAHHPPSAQQWKAVSDSVADQWRRFFRLAIPELQAVMADIQHTDEPEQRIRAAAAECPDWFLAEQLRDIAGRLNTELTRVGRYLDDVQRADRNTTRFVLDVLAQQDHQLRSLGDGQDPKQPEVWVAKLADPVVLHALAPHMVRDVRGRYSYRVYRFGVDDAVLYDGWMIARYQSLLNEISEGKVKDSDKMASVKTALALRCTFTTGARMDRAFMDWMRGLEAVKIGPNTFDIPCCDSEELETLKLQLKNDWGYPYCYQSVETPSRLLQTVNDVGSDGSMRFYALRVLPYEADAVVRQEQHAGRTYWVIRSQYPDRAWSGGYFRSKAAAESRLASIADVQRDVDVEALARAHARLQKAATASVGTEIESAVRELCEDTRIIAHLVFSSAPTAQTDIAAWLPTPRTGAVIQHGGRTYSVGTVLASNRGWFTAQGDDGPYVFLRPDLRGRGAIVTAEEFRTIEGIQGGPVTAVDVRGDVFEVASVVALMDPTGTTGTILDADRYANSPMGGTENWSPYFPSGFTPTGWTGGPKVLYYPSPQHGLQPVWDDQHYQGIPINLDQDKTTQQLVLAPERRPVQLYPDGVGQHPPMGLQPGDHPPTSHGLGLQPGDDPTKPIPYDPFLIVMPSKG